MHVPCCDPDLHILLKVLIYVMDSSISAIALTRSTTQLGAADQIRLLSRIGFFIRIGPLSADPKIDCYSSTTHPEGQPLQPYLWICNSQNNTCTTPNRFRNDSASR